MAVYTCEVCRKEVVDRPSHKRRFCSRECWYKTEEFKKGCIERGKSSAGRIPWIVGRKHTKETRQKISIAHKGKVWTESQRKAILPKLRRGENHPFWKGENATYGAIHDWVYRWKGKPLICEFCGEKNKLHWASKDHKYKRIMGDWISLCVSCHKYYDLERKKLNATTQQLSDFRS